MSLPNVGAPLNKGSLPSMHGAHDGAQLSAEVGRWWGGGSACQRRTLAGDDGGKVMAKRGCKAGRSNDGSVAGVASDGDVVATRLVADFPCLRV